MAIGFEDVGTNSGKRVSGDLDIADIIVQNGSEALYAFFSAVKRANGSAGVNTVTWDPGGADGVFANLGEHTRVGGEESVEIWKLIGPTPEATPGKIVRFNFSTTDTTWDGGVIGVMSLSGVNQTTPDDGYNSADGVSGESSVTVSSETDDLVLDCTAWGAGTITVGGGQTPRWNVTQNACRAGGSTEPGGASIEMTWSNSLFPWSANAVNINAAAAAGALFLPFYPVRTNTLLRM